MGSFEWTPCILKGLRKIQWPTVSAEGSRFEGTPSYCLSFSTETNARSTGEDPASSASPRISQGQSYLRTWHPVVVVTGLRVRGSQRDRGCVPRERMLEGGTQGPRHWCHAVSKGSSPCSWRGEWLELGHMQRELWSKGNWAPNQMHAGTQAGSNPTGPRSNSTWS